MYIVWGEAEVPDTMYDSKYHCIIITPKAFYCVVQNADSAFYLSFMVKKAKSFISRFLIFHKICPHNRTAPVKFSLRKSRGHVSDIRAQFCK